LAEAQTGREQAGIKRGSSQEQAKKNADSSSEFSGGCGLPPVTSGTDAIFLKRMLTASPNSVEAAEQYIYWNISPPAARPLTGPSAAETECLKKNADSASEFSGGCGAVQILEPASARRVLAHSAQGAVETEWQRDSNPGHHGLS